MKPARLSAEFSNPDIANEYLALAEESGGIKLTVRIHVPKLNAQGELVLNQRTKNPVMTWAVYDPEKDYVSEYQSLVA